MGGTRWPADFDARREALELLGEWVDANPDAHVVDGHIADVLRVSPYRVALETTYETRTLVLRSRPTDREEPASASLPDPWSVDAGRFEPLTPNASDITWAAIDGGPYVRPCAACAGHGSTACRECSRPRLFDSSSCAACADGGHVPCPDCSGRGRVECDVFVERRLDETVDVRVVEPSEGLLPTELFLRLVHARPTSTPLHVQEGARMHRVEQPSHGYRTVVRDLGEAERAANALLAGASVPAGSRIVARRLAIHEVRAFRLRARNGDFFYVYEPGPALYPDGFWRKGLRGWLEAFLFGSGRDR